MHFTNGSIQTDSSFSSSFNFNLSMWEIVLFTLRGSSCTLAALILHSLEAINLFKIQATKHCHKAPVLTALFPTRMKTKSQPPWYVLMSALAQSFRNYDTTSHYLKCRHHHIGNIETVGHSDSLKHRRRPPICAVSEAAVKCAPFNYKEAAARSSEQLHQ